MRRQRRWALLLALASAAAEAQPAPDEERLSQAKDFFRRGVAALQIDDLDRALELFSRSRALFASAQNTINMAVCLDRLGRFDEALELYEEIQARFAGDLDAEERASVAPTMARLGASVGRIDLQANVDGAVVIDGRPRGSLPLRSPLRALPGPRRVRVLKEGYQTAERLVDVPRGGVVSADLTLEPLQRAGLIRIEDPGSPGSEVFVDGVPVGPSPWEGTLEAGSHLIWTRKGDVGSAPTRAQVVQGVTVLFRARSSALGGVIRLRVSPATASLRLDGVDLGSGSWEGRLPAGLHEVAASEPGYHPLGASLRSDASAGASLSLELRVDKNHPRWPQKGHLWVGIFGGAVASWTLGGTAEASCPGACSSNPWAAGAVAGARAGYRFPSGLSVGLGAGYLGVGTSLQRSLRRSYEPAPGYPVEVQYKVEDRVRVSGPAVLAEAGYRRALAGPFSLQIYAGGGLLLARSRDDALARARTAEGEAEATLLGAGGEVSTAVPVVGLSAAALTRLGPVEAGLGISAYGLLTGGGDLPHREIQVEPRCSPSGLGAAGCVPGMAMPRERAFSPSVLLSPQLYATRVF